MIQVFRIDNNGFFIEPVIINDTDPTPIDCVTFMPPYGLYKPQLVNGSWAEGEDQNTMLNKAKIAKVEELNQSCNKAILANFTYSVNGVNYEFANDMIAQSNFDKLLNAFNGNMIQSISWTAYDSNGNVVRLAFDSTSYPDLYKTHLNHIQSNISKFRDTLQPQVEACTTIESVNAIVWS